MIRRLAVLMLVATACANAATPQAGSDPSSTTVAPSSSAAPAPTTTARPTTTTTTTTTTSTTTTTISPFARPAWLGTRVLPLREDGLGEVLPTPPELQDRRFATPDKLPPPTSTGFESTLGPVPEDVLARSTWREECPVGVDDLAYITFSHHGFDGELHTGEMIVNAGVAEDVLSVMEQIFDAEFPIEEFGVTTLADLDAPPTGDGNHSGSFSCRPATGRSGGWSQHAFGLAIDLNPFHNPYVKGDVVIPELASFYLDRSLGLPGMIDDDSVVVDAFASIGWGWGGDWTTLKDWMHFSSNGR